MNDPERLALRRRLIEGIRERGHISFAEFMEVALYDPADGFYARPPVGEDGHFVTSPHVSPAFGDLLARQVAQVWDLLDCPPRLDVVELGAGDGTLARQVLSAVEVVPELRATIRYLGVERTPGQLDALRAAGIDAAEWLPGDVTGCVIANEVMDNLPFHRLRRRGGETVEVRVGVEDGSLVEVEAEPDPEALRALDRPLAPGEERPASPAALGLIADLARSLRRGYALVFDYGFSGGEPGAPVHSYRGHEVLAEVLSDPGGRDVTAAVDLDAVAGAARRAGLQVWGPVTQRQALLALGYRMWAAGVRGRQAEAERTGEHRDAIRLYQERSRASLLIDEAKLGGLRLLAFGTRGLPPPAAVLGDRDQGC